MSTEHHSGVTAGEFRPLVFDHSEQVSECIKIFRFRFMNPSDDATECKSGQYIALKANINGEEIVRYYSPISCPLQSGYVELLIKIDDHGTMSHYLNSLVPNESTVEIKAPISGFEFDPEKTTGLGLIAMGTGLSPMIQISRHIMQYGNTSLQNVPVTLIYSALQPCDMVLTDELNGYARNHDHYKVIYTVDWVKPEDANNWPYHIGRIDAQLLKESLPPPGDGVHVVVCGPMKAMQAIRASLESLGYTKEMIYTYG